MLNSVKRIINISGGYIKRLLQSGAFWEAFTIGIIIGLFVITIL